MNEKISVIIPVYNVEPYLRQCLDSVVNQTYRNLEIIIVDDGSPDHCGEICDEYAQKDNRIMVVHKNNEGLCAARNEGIRRATGEWITFVDSDDWCEKDYYEQMIIGLSGQEPDILCSGGRIVEYTQRRVVTHTFPTPFQYTEEKEIERLMVGIMVALYRKNNRNRSGFGVPWDKLYNATFIKNNGLLFDVSSKAWEDLWFNFQAFSKAKNIKGCTYIGYHYRQVGTSIVNRFNPNKPEINYEFISKVYCYIKEQSLPQEIEEAVKDRTFHMILNSLDCYYFHRSNVKRNKEINKELKDMKNWPYFHQAIWGKCNQYLTFKQKIFKYVLRLPWIWPLKIIWSANQMLKKKERETGLFTQVKYGKA